MVRLLEAVPAKSRFRARAPLILGLLVFLALGALYWSYVSRRSEYLIDRDLRLLSAAAAQLDQQIDSHKGVMRNFAHADFWCGENGKAITEYGPASPQWLRKYMPDFVSASRGPQASLTMPVGLATVGGAFSNQLVPNSDGSYDLEIQYRSLKVTWNEHSECGPSGDSAMAIGRFPLNELVAPIFNKPIFGGAFDAVLIASSDGRVLYQAEPRAQQERRLVWNRITPAAPTDLNTTASLVVASLTNLRDKDAKQDKNVNVAALQSHTGSVDVEISGSTYRLLTQPYTYEAPSLSGAAGGRWIVCGLIERRRFLQEATEISASLIALATALLILTACCWPFMKLAFSGAAEPITRSDVVMVSVAVLLAAGIVSLIFFDLVIYGRMKSVADYQHRAFAVHAADEIQVALNNMLSVRDELEKKSIGYAEAYSVDPQTGRETGRVSRDNFGPRPTETDWLKNETSLFSSFAWVNTLGMQVIRASMTEGKPPLIDVSKRPYFLNVVRQKRLWTSSDNGHDRIHLRTTAFPFETAESEKEARKEAEEFRQKVVNKEDVEWGQEDARVVRRTLYDDLQEAISGLRPGGITPVVRTPKKFFVAQLVDEPRRQQFVIDSVRTLTNGQPEAVIAFPTDRPALPLFTITFPFVQLVERLGPPAMSYAVIDNAGTVLFHSDSERNGLENIFAETDHDTRSSSTRSTGAKTCACWSRPWTTCHGRSSPFATSGCCAP
jgi:hypothetical protein